MEHLYVQEDIVSLWTFTHRIASHVEYLHVQEDSVMYEHLHMIILHMEHLQVQEDSVTYRHLHIE